MIITMLEIFFTVVFIRYSWVNKFIIDQIGASEGIFSQVIQLISLVCYVLIAKGFGIFFRGRMGLEVEIINSFYGTEFSTIFLNSKGKTRDFERKLKIRIKNNFILNFPAFLLKKIFKDTYLAFEIKRDDISISSRDMYIESTQHGIKIPLIDTLLKYIEKTNRASFPMEFDANIIVPDISSQDNSEEIIIYPQLIDSKGKKILLRKIFLKTSMQNYRFKLKIES